MARRGSNSPKVFPNSPRGSQKGLAQKKFHNVQRNRVISQLPAQGRLTKSFCQSSRQQFHTDFVRSCGRARNSENNKNTQNRRGFYKQCRRDAQKLRKVRVSTTQRDRAIQLTRESCSCKVFVVFFTPRGLPLC